MDFEAEVERYRREVFLHGVMCSALDLNGENEVGTHGYPT